MRQDRSHPVTMAREPQVPDGVGANVEVMQAAGLDPSVNAPSAQSKCHQLAVCHDAMLPCRELGDDPVTWLLSITNSVLRSNHPRHGAHGGREMRA